MHGVVSGLAKIEVNNLSLRTYVGVSEEEMLNRQELRISLVLMYDATEAMENNDVDASVNYQQIVELLMQHAEEGRFALLERLAQELLDLVMRAKAVRYARIKVDRLLALRFVESVAVTLSARRRVGFSKRA